MKFNSIALTLVLTSLFITAKSQSKELEHHMGYFQKGLHGCIPTNNIILLATGEFKDSLDNGKYYIQFLGGTIHELNDQNQVIRMYERDNIYFRSDEPEANKWNAAIKGKKLNTIEIGIESRLNTPWLAKDYFEKVKVWIEGKPVYNN